MKAAVLTALRRIELQDRPVPEPGPGEVRVRVAAVGVCGSDVHYWAEGRIGSAAVQYPTVLGHEASGVVDAAGPGTRLAAGTRVAVEPAAACLGCELCRAGRFNVCPEVRFLGTPPVEGIFAEQRVVPEHCCLPLPAGLSLVEAALLEPMGVGLHAVRLARLEIGETVAVLGCGPIGLAVLLAARLAGAGRLYAADLIPGRLELARSLGADEVLDARRGESAERLRRLTGGRGADAVFEAAGDRAAVAQACLAARAGGRAVIVGIPPEDDAALPIHECRRRELAVVFSRRSNWELPGFLRLPAAGRADLAKLATHFFPLSRLAEALELAGRRADGVVRAMVMPNPGLAEGRLPAPRA